MSVKAQFVLARGLSSAVIQLAGGGTRALGFSHVDMVLPTGELLGSRTDYPVNGQTGVQIRPPDYAKHTWIRQIVMELKATPDQEALFYNYAKLQVGKPYDKLAIIAFFADRDWRDDEAWFCDELLLACTEKSGLCPPLYLPNNKFNPTGAACIWSALGASITPIISAIASKG
jgi:hypothetical protein